MARWVRLLLSPVAGVAGFFAGVMTFGGAAAGAAWIFLFGDDPWPAWSGPAIMLVAVGGGLLWGLGIGMTVWRATGRMGT